MFNKTILTISLFSILNASSYEDWLNSQNQEYNSYKKSMDEEFSDMLKKDWEQFKTMSNQSSYTKPKPVVIPKVEKEVLILKKDLNKSPKVLTPIITKKQIIKPKIILNKNIKRNEYVSFDFFGEKANIYYDKNIKFVIDNINKDMISSFWEHLSKQNYKYIIEQINIYSEKLNLNDWAKYQFIYKLGNSLYRNDSLANLFSWFILSKLHYDVKVGYNSSNIFLLATIKHSLYQVAFFNLKGKKYYILSPNGRISNIGNIYTYTGNYPSSTKQLSFDMSKEIKLYSNLEDKKLSFEFNDRNYNIDVKYSKGLINFYSTFPQSDYQIYFKTKNSTELSNTLLDNLQYIIKDKSELEAVNILLRFVQKSFAYKTDQKQFNYEKVMFPEETVYYPYSDCEDRSIMFSYLVKSLLQLDIIGLKYKDHLSTAVALNSKINGDGFMFKNKYYTIADPTYIGANIGMAMPQYKNSSFKVISFR